MAVSICLPRIRIRSGHCNPRRFSRAGGDQSRRFSPTALRKEIRTSLQQRQENENAQAMYLHGSIVLENNGNHLWAAHHVSVFTLQARRRIEFAQRVHRRRLSGIQLSLGSTEKVKWICYPSIGDHIREELMKEIKGNLKVTDYEEKISSLEKKLAKTQKALDASLAGDDDK